MSATARTPTASRVAADGLMLAPVGRRGPWGALRSLRAGMRDLRRQGTSAHVSFVVVLSREGRLVSPRDTAAAVFVLGYGTDDS
jgi:hypothetical protein